MATLLTGQSGIDAQKAAALADGTIGTGTQDQAKLALTVAATEKYSVAADKALDYLSQRLFDKKWVEQHDDVAYYFKAPLAFLEAGRQMEAEKAFAIAIRYMEQGGSKSANRAYSLQYPHYPLMYMCWAATILKHEDIADACFHRIEAFVHPVTGSGLVTAPYCEGSAFEADCFATALVVKAALLRGKMDLAKSAGAALARALTANRDHMSAGRFYLRWQGETIHDIQLMSDPDKQHDHFHCVLKAGGGQRYFFVGFPAMTLLELSMLDAHVGEGHRDAYRDAALGMLNFLWTCEGLTESPTSHKVARAAAMAALQVPKTDVPHLVNIATSIADNFVFMQKESGCFHHDQDAMDSVDQTAEISLWLRQLQGDLATLVARTSGRE